MSETGDAAIWQWIAITLVGILGALAKYGSDRHTKRMGEQDQRMDRIDAHMSAIDSSQKEYKLHVAENYVKDTTMRERIAAEIRPVTESQTRIENKLDQLLLRELDHLRSVKPHV